MTIRLLDPPLHEFLPKYKEVLEEYTQLDALGINPARHQELGAIKARLEALQEANPMLGHRGCRLGITFPEIYEMQVRAIMEAACAVAKRGVDVQPEIMIPLTGTVAEMKLTEEMTRRVAEAVTAEHGRRVPYMVGTMIEVPRAALIADQMAQHAEFFSFGTNDLTQMTFGYSRDDIGKFLPFYLDKKLLPADPFAVLDQEGVGELIQIGIERGRKTRPDLKIGICGEHGGEPSSVEFCHRVGMDLRVLLAVHGSDRVAGGGAGPDQGAPRGGSRQGRRQAPCVSSPASSSRCRRPTGRRGRDGPAPERTSAVEPDRAQRLRGPRLHGRVPDAVRDRARRRPGRRPEAIPRDRAFIAGTGSDSTLLTIRQTKRAAEIGADAAIVITPHYFTKGVSPAGRADPTLPRRRRGLADPGHPLQFPAQHGDQPRAGHGRPHRRAPQRVRHQGLARGTSRRRPQIIHLTPKTFHVLVGSAAALLPALAIGSVGGHSRAGRDRGAGVRGGLRAGAGRAAGKRPRRSRRA